MANRYWVGSDGNWTDTAHWSTSSGGASGASVPTSSDNVFFDNNSDNGIGTNANVGTTATCLNLDSSAYSHGNGLSIGTGFTQILNVYGSFTLSPQTFTVIGHINFKSTTTGNTITRGGGNGAEANPTTITFDGVGGAWTLLDEFRPGSVHIKVVIKNGTLVLQSGVSFSWDSLIADGSISNQLNLKASTPGNAATLKLTQQPGPTAGFTAIPVTGIDPLTVNFTDTSILGMFSYLTVTDITANGTPTTFSIYPGGVNGGGNTGWSFDQSTFTWAWDFKSDGMELSSLQNPTHVYTPVGTYVPQLTVGNSVGTDIITPLDITVTVGPNLFLQTVFLVGADPNGDIQTVNAGKDDDGTPIYYELETQELEFGNRSHLKKISDKIVVFSKNAVDSNLEAKQDQSDYKPLNIVLDERVNIGQDIKLEGYVIKFKWFGNSSTDSPVFEGLFLEKVTDLGMTDA